MMNLHKNKELFADVALEVSAATKIDIAIIKQDYFVSLLLANIVNELPDIIFKGGTSLSKCYGIINRYSEDIDLNYFYKENFTNSTRKKIAKGVASAIKKSEFEYMNEDQLESGKNMNVYFANINDDGLLSESIKVETFLAMKSYPIERKMVDSYMHQYLKSNGFENIIEEYNLQPYEINTQSIKRTFIDKVFAICDYYETKTYNRNSRHIYDLYQLHKDIIFDEEYFSLMEAVREERKTRRVNISAADGYKIAETVAKIYNEDFYKSDYEEITSKLIFDGVKYSEAKAVLKLIEKNYRK